MPEVRIDESGSRDDLRATRFTLVDEHGAARAALGPSGDGAVGLTLYDREQRPRAELGVDAAGAANLKLHGPEGEVSAWLAVGRHGAPTLYLHGASQHRDGVRGHAELSVDEHGSPVLSLHDRFGQARVLLSLDERTGMATLCCADAHGESRVLLGEDEGGGLFHVVERRGLRDDVPVLPIERPRNAGPYPQLAAMAARLARLERAARRRRVGLRAVVLAVVLAAALAGVAGRRFVRPVPAAAPPEPVAAAPHIGPVVHAEEIVLEDRTGAMRARLSVLPDGTPLLWMSDPGGESTAEITVLAGSGAFFRLGAGPSSIVLSAPPNDPPSLGAFKGDDVLFQAPSHVARFMPPDLWP
jgi:hypothetical protein